MSRTKLLSFEKCQIAVQFKIFFWTKVSEKSQNFPIKSKKSNLVWSIVWWSDLNLLAAADKLKSVGDIFKESRNFEAADSAPEFPTMESIENPIFLVEFVEFAVTFNEFNRYFHQFVSLIFSTNFSRFQQTKKKTNFLFVQNRFSSLFASWKSRS